MDQKYSIVEFLHDRNSSCGYCKNTDTHHNTGMWAYTMTVEDYQDLIDRGWRRSGQYCYKPIQRVTCCPLYTIRCESLNLKLSKSQKKILKRVGKYLSEGGTAKNTHSEEADCDSSSEMELPSCEMFDKGISHVIDQKTGQKLEGLMEIDVSANREDKLKTSKENKLPEQPFQMESKTCFENKQESRANPEKCSHTIPKPGNGRDMSKPQCKKAKLLRLEKKQKKILEKGQCVDTVLKKKTSSEKSLEDLIEDFSTETSINKLELRLVRSFPMTREFEDTFKEEHLLYQKYQMAIHKDPITKVTELQFTRFLVTSPLKIRIVPSDSKEESVKESWHLFRKYQMAIHNEAEDECSYKTFHSFLVETPLKAQEKLRDQISAPSTGYGSFHQQYWLNGKLIAVGVIDILPKCVSSVYFFYDPDYNFLSLGTYGSLREMELVRSLQKQSPELCYYYMGFYIHSCPKMRYKARYSPSSLLCPEVYTWHPIAECQRKLDVSKYCRFNDNQDAVCENSFVTINEVLILYNRITMDYSTYKARARRNITDSEEEEVQKYAELVGRRCAKRMLLYR